MAKIVGNNSNNTLTGTTSSDRVFGLGGNDIIYGLHGNDQLFGGSGNDILFGGSGIDTYSGGYGNDIFHITNTGWAVHEGINQGFDTIVFEAGSGPLPLNVEGLVLAELNGTQRGDGNSASNVIKGNSDVNFLYGHGGHDHIAGHGGNDKIIGGSGSDFLEGGGGADTFIYESVSDSPAHAGRDRIHDWSQSQGDKIDLSIIDADLTLSGNQAFTQGSYNFSTGILTADVIGGAGLQIEIVGGGALNLAVDIIL